MTHPLPSLPDEGQSSEDHVVAATQAVESRGRDDEHHVQTLAAAADCTW